MGDHQGMKRSIVLILMASCTSTSPASTTLTSSAAAAPTSGSSALDPCAGVPALTINLGFACIPAEGGSYRMELNDVTDAPCELCQGQSEDEGEEIAREGTISVVFVGESGQRAVGDPIYFHVESTMEITFEARAVFDFDGDGMSELVLYSRRDVTEDGRPTAELSTQFLTPEGNSLVEYGPSQAFSDELAHLRRADVVDADGDDRPDFATSGPWSELGSGILIHSLADGTFSRVDAVAEEFTAAFCEASSPLVPRWWNGDEDDDADQARAENMDFALAAVTCAALVGPRNDALIRLATEWAEAQCPYSVRECAGIEASLRERIVEVATWRASP